MYFQKAETTLLKLLQVHVIMRQRMKINTPSFFQKGFSNAPLRLRVGLSAVLTLH